MENNQFIPRLKHVGFLGFKFVKFFHHTEERFKLAQERDNKKSKLCEENNCKLLYYSDIEEVVDNEKIFDLENIKKMLNDLKNEK